MGCVTWLRVGHWRCRQVSATMRELVLLLVAHSARAGECILVFLPGIAEIADLQDALHPAQREEEPTAVAESAHRTARKLSQRASRTPLQVQNPPPPHPTHANPTPGSQAPHPTLALHLKVLSARTHCASALYHYYLAPAITAPAPGYQPLHRVLIAP
jgi:hypothetical protein